MTITGAGSTFDGTTVNVGVAGGGTGTLTLASGGTIEATTVTVVNTGSTFTADTIAVGALSGRITTLNIETGATAAATTIDIGSGGSFNLNRTDGIISASAMNLSGGTFNTGGNDQSTGGLGNLTMTASSVIDMGTTDSVINWATIDEGTWTGTLSIHRWTGVKNTAGGTDQLRFTNITGFNLGDQINFYSDAGTTFLGVGRFRATSTPGVYELVPAPEPSTWVGIGMLLAFAGWYEWRRRKKK